jgi:hypothetical protein
VTRIMEETREIKEGEEYWKKKKARNVVKK